MKKTQIGVFSLAMINIAAVLSLRTFPIMAEYGYTLLLYLGLSAIFFFIPSALISAELAATWSERGGVYLWVKKAFGMKWGFVAIFLQWVENLPWFPAALAFMASAIAYIFQPELAENKLFVIAIVWSSIWIATFLNFKGIRFSAILSTSGVILGTIIPGLFMALLGIFHFFSQKESAITFSRSALLPNLQDLNHIMLLAGMLMALTGMEMSAVHVKEVKNPQKNFPKSIFIACVGILFLSIAGSMSIALIIPREELSLSAGVLQAFQLFFEVYHLPWLGPIVAFFLAYGVFTMVVTWMIGPTRGILEVAKEERFSQFIQKENAYNMPIGALLIQAAISSLIALAILFMPTVSGAFWIMTALAAQLYLIMYLLMFAAAIRLRYLYPNIKRPYQVLGEKKIGIWIVASSAFIASLFSIICGFIPPLQIRILGFSAILSYIGFLVIGIAICILIPLTLHNRAKKSRR